MNKTPSQALGTMLFLLAGISWSQAIPIAPQVPACSWDDGGDGGGGARSTCKFKDASAGTPTSVTGNRVILFSRSAGGGHADSRRYLQGALGRLSTRYGFTTTVSDDPAIFTAANLADAKVVLMSNGDGDVVPAGARRTALEDFQQVNGWGLVWIHAACSFITSGWPFGQRSCVQQYYHHNPSGTARRMFIDSGTTSTPEQGRRNPQSEFLLRDLPGWGSNRSLAMSDEWFCFQAPARNTEGVNVLFGYDRGSGLPSSGCPLQPDASEAASQSHNMAWTHRMGNGITIVNSWGHDDGVYTASGNMGDSLLWRYIRYAAKDWCVSGSGEPGCDAPTSVRAAETALVSIPLQGDGIVSLPLTAAGRNRIIISDVGGRIVAVKSATGPGKMTVPGLRRGLYLMRIGGEAASRARRILVF